MCLAVSITLRPAQASAQLAEKLIGPDPPVPPAVIVRDEAGLATVRASRLDGEFVLDGALTEAIYTSVLPYADFVQQEPAGGTTGHREDRGVAVLRRRQRLRRRAAARERSRAGG